MAETTLKKIKAKDLKAGMFVAEVHSSWLTTPFGMKNYLIKSRSDIDQISEYGIGYVTIDTRRGVNPENVAEIPPNASIVTMENTFEAALSDFPENMVIPLDIYIYKDGKFSQILKRGLAFSFEVSELLRKKGVDGVRVPKSQGSDYERYKQKVEIEKEKRKEALGDTVFENVEEVEEYLSFKAYYHPINPECLIPGTRTNFTIYLHIGNTMTIGLEKREIVDEDQCGWWITEKINVMIKKEERGAFGVYLIKNTRDSKNERVKATFIRENSKLVVEGLAENPRSGKLMKEAKVSVLDMMQLVIDNPTTFYSLTTINNYDYYTYTHSINVCTLSLGMAISSGIEDKKDLMDLGLGAMLHDLGKSKVSQRILNKPGALTADERLHMEKHVLLGREMLYGRDDVSERAMIPLMQHHERLNGSGYPNSIGDDMIDTFGRISAIMDTYDALTTERIYRKAFKPFDALNLILQSDDEYDKQLLFLLVKILGAQHD